jgi:hypothetical protein
MKKRSVHIRVCEHFEGAYNAAIGHQMGFLNYFSGNLDNDGMFPDAVVRVTQHVPVSRLRLPAPSGVCCAGHDRVFACLPNIP